jgi:opacity protein-like surface antigen
MTFWPVAFSAGYLFATDGDLHWGFEAEAGMMNMDNFVMPPGYSNFQHQRLYASLSARAGLAIDRFMPYASVGLRATSVDMAVDIAAPPGPAWRETMTGFGLNPTATIGAEFAITDTIAVKAEISHTFGSVFLTQSNGATADFYPGSSVGVGVNVRF